MRLALDPSGIKGFLDPAEGERLYELARAAAPLGPCLEIGSYCGKSTIYLGSGVREAGGVLFTLDHHRGSEEHQPGQTYHDPELMDAAQSRFDSLPHLRGPELRRLLPHASNRCVIGIHDTTTHRDPLKGELAAMAKEGLIVPPLYLPTPRGVGFTRVAPK